MTTERRETLSQLLKELKDLQTEPVVELGRTPSLEEAQTALSSMTSDEWQAAFGKWYQIKEPPVRDGGLFPLPPPIEEATSALRTMTPEAWQVAYGQWYQIQQPQEAPLPSLFGEKIPIRDAEGNIVDYVTLDPQTQTFIAGIGQQPSDLETMAQAEAVSQQQQALNVLYRDIVRDGRTSETDRTLVSMGARPGELDQLYRDTLPYKRIRDAFVRVYPDFAEQDEETIERALRSVDYYLDNIRFIGRNPDTVAFLMALDPTLSPLRPQEFDRRLTEFFGVKSDDYYKEQLRIGGVAEKEIDNIIRISKLDLTSNEWREKLKAMDSSTARGIWHTIGMRSAAATIGMMIQSGAGFLEFAGGKEEIVDSMMRVGKTLAEDAPTFVPFKDASSLVDPQFWLTTGVQGLTTTATLLPVGLLGAYAGLGLGIGTVGTIVMARLFPAIGAAGLEAGLEAGDVYNQGKAAGLSDSDLAWATAKTFALNFAVLTGTNFVTFSSAFLPKGGWGAAITKLATKGFVRYPVGSIVPALSEGGQEWIQYLIAQQALGQPVEWDDEAKTALALGGMMGLFFGSGANMFNIIQERTKARFTTEQRTEYDASVAEFKATGLTDEQAGLRALDDMAQNAEVKTIIEETTTQVVNEDLLNSVVPVNQAQAVVIENVKNKLRKAAADVALTTERMVRETEGTLPGRAEEVTPVPEVTELTADVWANMTTAQRLPLIRAKGLDSSRVLVNWEGLTIEERSALTGKPEVAIPTGMTPKTWAEGILAIAELGKETQAVTAPKPSAKSIREAHKILGDIPVRQRMPKNLKDYINRIKNVNKKQYAQDYAEWVLKGEVGVAPRMPLEKLGFMAQQSVEMEIRDRLKAIAIEIKPEAAIPKAEAGMPEAGLQPSMLPEQVAGREVRPAGKGRVVQISMEDQLKLQQARQAAEIAPAEEKAAYEAQAEIEGLKATHEADPVAQYRFKMGGRNVGLDSLISIKEQNFPEYFTVKQAQALNPDKSFAQYSRKGEKQYNKVPRDVVLDDLTKRFNMTPDEIADRVMQIRKEKGQLKEHGDTIKRQMTETPITIEKETKDVSALINVRGEPLYTIEQIDALSGVMGEYLVNPNTLNAYRLVRQYQALERARRFRNVSGRRQELIVTEWLSWEDAHNKAMDEFARGKLPSLTVEGLENITSDLRDVFFAKVHYTFDQLGSRYEGERWATITALTNALAGKPIPMDKGKGSILFPKGGSAWDRLNYVFSKQPRLMEGLTKNAKENKSLKDVTEGIFREVPEGGMPPIPIDEATAEYLRALANIPFGKQSLLEPKWQPPPPLPLDTRTEREKALDLQAFKLELMPDIWKDWSPERLELMSYLRVNLLKKEYQAKLIEEKWIAPPPIGDTRTAAQRALGLVLFKIEMAKPPLPPVTRIETPIDKAFRQGQLWARPVRDGIIRVLKEIGMLPIDIGNFLRASKASVDFSFWRQQAPLIASHPVPFFEANIQAWRALWSQKSTEASWVRITRDPLYQIYEEAAAKGGDFLRPVIIEKGTAQWKGTEEYGYSKGVERLLPKLTAALPWVKLSARAFETGTNVHNWLIFKSYYGAMLRYGEQIASGQKKLKPGEAFDIEKEMVDFSKSLANFSARGSLGKFAATAPELSALFFAPRAAIGRILSVADLINANPRVRLEAWKNASSFVGTFGGIILLGAAMGWWEVEKDPRSAEYMSIRIGNTRYDPWGGFRQFVVFFARAITGTGVSSVTGAEYEADPLNLLQTFIRGKASPLASLALDFWRGKNFIGEEVDVANKRQWAERIAPFALWDIFEAYQDDPIHAFQAAIPAIVGAGVQTYTGDWKENFTKLGLPKYSENFIYGLTEPRYDLEDFWSDTVSQFKGVDPATLTESKGFPAYIRDMVETKQILDGMSIIPNEKLVSLNADPGKDEPTYIQYYQRWRERKVLEQAGDNAIFKDKELQPDGKYKEITYKGEDAIRAFDKKYPRAYLGNMTQRQFASLNDYWAITDKKKQSEFLKAHEGEIGTNLRDAWLRSHPGENARLALYGKAKLLTKEAYDIYQQRLKGLDYPDNAIPEMTLPPEGSIDNYFKYQDMENKNSWEAQLVLAKDDDLLKFLGRLPIDTPIASLELKVKNRELFDKLDDFSDRDSPDYIADEKARAEAVKKFKADNPKFVDDTRRIEAIEHGGLKVKSDIKSASFEEARKWLEHDKLGHKDEKGKALDEWSQHWLDNYDFILKTLSDIQAGKINPGDINKSLEILDRDIFHDEPPEGWDAFFKTVEPIPGIPPEIRPSYFERTVEEFRRISALLRSKLPEGVSPSNYFIDRHVEYGRLIDQPGIGSSSAEAMLFRVDNPDYNTWRMDESVWGDQALKPIDQSKIPIWRIDVKWAKEDDELKAILDRFPGVSKEQTAAVKDYLDKRPSYRQDRLRRDAYGLLPSSMFEIQRLQKIYRTEMERGQALVSDFEQVRQTFYQNYGLSPELAEKLDAVFIINKKLVDASGIYEPGTIYLSNPTGASVRMLIAHEMAHQMWDFLSKTQQDNFNQIMKTTPGLADWTEGEYGNTTGRSGTEAYATLFSRLSTWVSEGHSLPPGIEVFYPGVDLSVVSKIRYLPSETQLELEKLGKESPLVLGVEDFVENYVKYYELPDKGFRRERYLIEHEEFWSDMLTLKGIDVDPAKVPSEQWDIITEKYVKEDDEYLAILDKYDQTQLAEQKQAIADFLAQNPTYAYDRYQRDAYGKFVPDKYVTNYADYYTLQAKGKPEGYPKDVPYWEDDWFLMENSGFYNDVYVKILGNERRDFRNVPSRNVFAQYQVYLGKGIGKDREAYRRMLWNNGQTDYEEWLLRTGKVTEHIKDKKEKKESAPLRKRPQSRAGWRAELEELLDELRR